MAGFFLHKGISDKVRIARFVDMNACKSIFSEHSTFVLRSPVYYRRFYHEGGDDRELRIRTAGGGSAESSGVVLSCWTILDGDVPTPKEWEIFPQCKKLPPTVVAIISTPDRVCAMLEEAFEMERDRRRFPFGSVKHRVVTYADEVAEERGPENIWQKTVFTKRLQFARQKEYRFALPYTYDPHMIDSYIFVPRNPADYMDKCLANPTMCGEDKHNLCCILGNAIGGYGSFSHAKKIADIIANADILLDR